MFFLSTLDICHSFVLKAVDIKILGSLNREDLKKICGENLPEWISFPVYEQVRLFHFYILPGTWNYFMCAYYLSNPVVPDSLLHHLFSGEMAKQAPEQALAICSRSEYAWLFILFNNLQLFVWYQFLARFISC